MKKFFSILFVATMLGMVFTACGDDKDDPELPKAQNLESVHEGENDSYFVFDIDMDNDKGTIYMYNIQFAGAPMAMNLRVNAPVSLNTAGNAYILSGSGLVAEMKRGDSWTPMPGDQYQLQNLMCTVNPKAKLYSIAFDAHGGHFEETGKLK